MFFTFSTPTVSLSDTFTLCQIITNYIVSFREPHSASSCLYPHYYQILQCSATLDWVLVLVDFTFCQPTQECAILVTFLLKFLNGHVFKVFAMWKNDSYENRWWNNLVYKFCFISIGPDFKILCTDVYTFTITYDQGNLYKLRYVDYIIFKTFENLCLRKMDRK